ncbi:LysM domain receptor-like kinase 10, partial [Geodia barretti]
MEVAYRGTTMYAAKKYRHVDRATVLNHFGQDKFLCRIQHPNLVAYCGVGSLAIDHSPVVIMERMDMNLSTFLETNSLPVEQKLKIISEVTKGLNHLHSLTPIIVHGDLNDKNVLISTRVVAKIADFGNNFIAPPELASAAQRAALEYMPPEIIEGSNCNEKVDIFSFGHLTIYVMNQCKPHPILGPTFRKGGELTARSEVERRANFLDEMKVQLDGGGTHPLFMMVTDCLDDDADQRPSCQDILKRGIFTEMFPGGNEEQAFGPDTVVKATSVILGHGAFGSVIEVECRGKLYAAKRFHPENEFNEEHKILAHIRHRNVVPYHGMCKLAPDNTPVLVMERMEMNLGTYLTAEQNTNLTLDRKFEILQDVIQGLNHIHTHSPIIIHRDLTAQNVLLDAQGTAKIGDFGNSYTVKLNVAMQELPSATPGTMNYMPPEAQDAGEFDEKIDVFSFGHLALYVMIQHPPHPLLAHTYTVEGVHHARSEVQRRQLYLDQVTDN